jgi:hypothetical protein
MQSQGTGTSIATAYRVINELASACLLLRERNGDHKAPCRVKPHGFDQQPLRMQSGGGGNDRPLNDASLPTHILAVARREGLRVGGETVTIVPG